VVEVVAVEELVFRRRGAADEDAVDLVTLGHEQVVCHARDLLVEVVDGLETETGEPLCGLTALFLLARHQRGGRFDRVDALAPEPAVRLPPVQHDQPKQPLVREHLLQGFGQKLRVTVISERLYRLGRTFEHPGYHI